MLRWVRVQILPLAALVCPKLALRKCRRSHSVPPVETLIPRELVAGLGYIAGHIHTIKADFCGILSFLTEITPYKKNTRLEATPFPDGYGTNDLIVHKTIKTW